MHHTYLNSLAYRWTLDIVKTPMRMSINIILLIIMGYYGIASDRLSILFLAVGGGLMPVIYTYCIYKLLKVVSDKFTENSLLVLTDNKKLTIICAADILLQLTFIALIIADVLSSNLFRIIACPVLPILQSLSLRVLLTAYLKN